ncbi:acyl carrier protein [Streptomyces spiramyceticus]|uniref:acyl carrier protein n=1 Tax=Streptomyces spiramyceticus TaxID=299717 RepID=UPI00237AB456|nr:acyl carrier protein [Streptomyces spiramyceticus]
MSTARAVVDTTVIRDWLVERIAFYLETGPEDIGTQTELVDLGLDSVYALTLCGDVEDRFGLALEPTMAWDHPTVDALTAHLAQELSRQ